FADAPVDAGLGIEGEQLAGGFAGVGGHLRHILCKTPGRVSCYPSPAAPAHFAAIEEPRETPWPTRCPPENRWSSTSLSSGPARPGLLQPSGSSRCRRN